MPNANKHLKPKQNRAAYFIYLFCETSEIFYHISFLITYMFLNWYKTYSDGADAKEKETKQSAQLSHL